MRSYDNNATRGARQHARRLLRSSWTVVQDIAYGVDSLSAMQHGGRRAARTATRAARK